MKSPEKKRQTAKRKSHSVPNFYGVYLLQSIPKPRSFYIGSTPDPIRRLRQHNGELKAGAYRTKRKGLRPWNMILLVHGFPSKISALQFEHAFQHPYQTRHIPQEKRITLKKSSGNTLHHKLGNLRLLIGSTFFSRMNLSLQIFDDDIYHDWCMNKFGVKIADFVKIDRSFKDIAEFRKSLLEYDDAFFDKSKEIMSFGTLTCSLCDEDIDYTTASKEKPLMTICNHDSCKSVSHLYCIGKSFINQERNHQETIAPSQSQTSSQHFLKKQTGNIDFSQYSQNARNLIRNDLSGKNNPSPTILIPIRGNCPGCGKVNIWSTLVKNSTKMRQYAKREEINDMESDEEINEEGFV